MSTTNNNYRKQIGLFNNKKHDKFIHYNQNKSFSNRLVEIAANETQYSRASSFLNIILLLANVTQGAQGSSAPVGKMGNQATITRASDHIIAKRFVAVSNVHDDSMHTLLRYNGTRNRLAKTQGSSFSRHRLPHKKSDSPSFWRQVGVNPTPDRYHSETPNRGNNEVSLKAAPAGMRSSFMSLQKMASIKTLLNIHKKSYPNLYKVAADEIKKSLLKLTGLSIDPDAHYFYRFTSAENDPASVTGWRHDNAKPIESRTLTECVLYNFSADARDNMDIVDQMTGIYNVSASFVNFFGSENQVPIKPSVIANIIIDMDFFNLYTKKLEQYWQTDIQEYIFVAQLLVELSHFARNTEKNIKLFLQAFNLIPSKEMVIKKYLFDINGYAATDIIVLAVADRLSYVIYFPGENSGIFYFNSLSEMKTWFIKNCRKKQSRDAIASHFSIYNRQNGNIYDGINSWLKTFSDISSAKKNVDSIWKKRYEIRDDLMEFIVSQQKNRAMSDADSLIKSNGEVRRDMAIRYFSIMNTLLPNPVTPFVSWGLDIDKMANGDDESERNEAAHLVFDDCLNVALIALGGMLEGRLSIVYKEGSRVQLSDVPLSERLKNEMNSVRYAERSTSENNFLPKLNKNNLARHLMKKDITFHPNMLIKLDKLGVKGTDISWSQLSKANRFGIMKDARSRQYIIMEKKLYRVRPRGPAGYFTFDENNNIGIFFDKKLRQYRLIDLRKWHPTAPYPCKMARSIRRPSSPLCLLQLSPRVRKILAKHLELNPFRDVLESNIVYDKDRKIFMNTVNNQMCIRYSDRYFPVKDIDGGYTIFKPGDNGKDQKLIRVFFSINHARSYLVTKMERIGEIFNRALFVPKLSKMKLGQSWRVHEKLTGLRNEVSKMQALLKKEYSSFNHSPEYIDNYSNVLSSLAKKQIFSPVLEEYTEAGSDLINNWLRFDINSVNGVALSAEGEARELLSDFEKMHDLDSYAFRSVECPAGVYGHSVVEGDVVMDKGFMSASALPGNAIGWKEAWTKEVSRTKGDQIILIFDKNVQKKVAGTGFLIDHILIKPRTPLKVVSISTATDSKGKPVRVVGVSAANDTGPIKDIFSGGVMT